LYFFPEDKGDIKWIYFVFELGMPLVTYSVHFFFLLFTDEFCFLFQKSRKQPSILKYFSEICSLDDELTNDMLAGIDFEAFESSEKRPELN
jgi:hypothetical protein